MLSAHLKIFLIQMMSIWHWSIFSLIFWKKASYFHAHFLIYFKNYKLLGCSRRVFSMKKPEIINFFLKYTNLIAGCWDIYWTKKKAPFIPFFCQNMHIADFFNCFYSAPMGFCSLCTKLKKIEFFDFSSSRVPMTAILGIFSQIKNQLRPPPFRSKF